MIKKFNQYIKESKKFNKSIKEELSDRTSYENTIISSDEYNDLRDSRRVLLSSDEIEKIKKHVKKKYSHHDIRVFNSVRKNSRLSVEINNRHEYIAFNMSKITDEWFIINLYLSPIEGPSIYFKCDEMQGLLNKIDELIEIYL